MDFDPEAPVDVLPAPADKPVVKPLVFDPNAAVDAGPKPVAFHPEQEIDASPAKPGAAPAPPSDGGVWLTRPDGTQFKSYDAEFDSQDRSAAALLGKNAEHQMEKQVTLPTAPDMSGIMVPGGYPVAPMAALYNAGVKPLVEGLSSPVGLGTLPVSAVSKPVSAVLAAAFAALMAHGTVEQVKEAKKVFADPNATPQQLMEAVIAPASTAAMAVTGAAGALHEVKGSLSPKTGPITFPEETPRTSSPVMFKPEMPVELEAPKTEAKAAPVEPAVIAPVPVSKETPSVSAVEKFEPETPVDIGPRDESVSTGTGVETPKETEMMAKWREDMAKETAAAPAAEPLTPGQAPVTEIPSAPKAPNFATATSDEISTWNQEMREFERNIDVHVLGEDLAKEHRRNTRIAESPSRSAGDPAVIAAMKRLGEIEGSLTPERQRIFYGMDLPKDFIDAETARDLSRRTSDIDTSDTVQELARASSHTIRDALRKMSKGEKLEGVEGEIFLRAMRRAKELDASPQDLVKASFQHRAKFEGNDVFELAGVTPEQLGAYLEEKPKAQSVAEVSKPSVPAIEAPREEALTEPLPFGKTQAADTASGEATTHLTALKAAGYSVKESLQMLRGKKPYPTKEEFVGIEQGQKTSKGLEVEDPVNPRGPDIGPAGYEALKAGSGREPVELPAENGVNYKVEIRGNKIWLTAAKTPVNGFSETAIAFLHSNPEGKTTAGGSFLLDNFPNKTLATAARDRLERFIQETASKKASPVQEPQRGISGEDMATTSTTAQSSVNLDVLGAQQTDQLKKMSESKLLALTKQLDIDPKGMSGDRLRARIQSNAHPEDIADALKGRGLISGSEAEKWADSVLKKKRGQLNAGIDPEQFAAYTVKGLANFERGITDFSKWSAEMLKELGEEIKPHLTRLYRAAKELQEEGRHAADASPEALQEYLADFRNGPEDSAATESTPPSRGRKIMDSFFHGEPPDVTGALKGMAGESAPKTSTLNEEAGNALVRYASAKIAAPEISRSYAGQVLGEHLHDQAFANKLGTVLNEDRLRTIKAGFLKEAADLTAAGDAEGAAEKTAQAANVTTLVGKEGSPLKTEADFKAALADPELKAAIDRHKELVQPLAEKMHVDLGGRKAKPGQNTGAFVNLLPIDETGTELRGGVGKGSGKGDLTAPLKKGSAFNKRSYGSAENYNSDYNEIARAMISGNFSETAKRTLYDKLTDSGLGQILPPGEEAPVINGHPARKIQIERRGLGGRTLIRNLWVDRRIYPEVIRGMGLDETFKSSAVNHLANVLNTIQIKGPVDGVAHIANILTSIAGSQGGKSVVGDLIRRLPGVNVVDTLTRIFLRARDVVKDSPEIRQELAKVAEIGASRQPHEGAMGLNRLIGMVDKAARLVRNDMYDNLVERGWAKDSESGRREFINQVGQYNSRLMGQMTAKFKEWGLSPFVVAGQTFNRNALRRVSGTPGIQAASTAANVKLRATELAGLAAYLVAIPAAINYALSGKPQGRSGVPFGAIDTGKTDDNGKAIIVDPQQWTGVRRGLRLTGVNSLLASRERGDLPARTADMVARDMIGGFIHPYAGPLVNTALTAATGYNAAMFRQAPKAAPGHSQMAENAVAAAKQLNPFVGNAIEGLQNDGGKTGLVKGLVKPFTSAAGIKAVPVTSNVQDIQTKATQYNDSLGIARYEGGRPSEYLELTKAVRSENPEKATDVLQELIERKAAEIPGNLAESAKLAMAKRAIAEYYRRKASDPFTGSLTRERAFKATLSAEEMAQYNEAKRTNRQTAQSVRRLIYGQ